MALKSKQVLILHGKLPLKLMRFFSASDSTKKTQETQTAQVVQSQKHGSQVQVNNLEKAEGVSVASRVVKIDKNALTPHQYWITQGKGNERPFTGKYHDHKEIGSYACAVCHSELFM